MADFYDVLGVPKNASQKDIRQAYRGMARQFHPDVNGGEKTSEEKFKQINEAYSVLSDEGKRRRYDRHGDNWANSERIEEAARGRRGGFRWSGQGGNDSFSFSGMGGSIFEGLFDDMGQRDSAPRPTKLPPTEYPAEISLEEAHKGAIRLVGLPGGRRLEVKIPAGVDNGSKIHFAPDGGSEGEFFLVVSIKEHPRFRRQGRDLYTDVETSLEDAILGNDLTVTTLTGRLALTVPPETQNGRRFRLAGQGMPVLNEPDVKGDLYATIKVTLPTDLSPEEQELFLRFKELRAEQGS
jgi:DnaJ-class molecular chaperone